MSNGFNPSNGTENIPLFVVIVWGLSLQVSDIFKGYILLIWIAKVERIIQINYSRKLIKIARDILENLILINERSIKKC